MEGPGGRKACANLLPNLAFRGVFLPQGAKHVSFDYQPWQISVGATLSITTLVLLAGFWICADQKKRPQE